MIDDSLVHQWFWSKYELSDNDLDIETGRSIWIMYKKDFPNTTLRIMPLLRRLKLDGDLFFRHYDSYMNKSQCFIGIKPKLI